MEEGHKLKKRVRLFRAEDVIYMTLGYDARNSEWEDIEINEKGYRLSTHVGCESEKVVTTYSMTWDKVANALGSDVCEYVINPDNARCVLLYDIEEEEY